MMTREDFERIAAHHLIRSGDVKIELNSLGFIITARRTGRRAKQRITYAEAFEMQYPVRNFNKVVAELQAAVARTVRPRTPRKKKLPRATVGDGAKESPR